MEIICSTEQPEKMVCDAIVVGISQDGVLADSIKNVDAALDGYASKLIKNKEFIAEFGSLKSITTLGKLPCKLVLLVGLGKKDALSLESLRKLQALSIKVLREANAKEIVSALSLVQISNTTISQRTNAVSEGAILGLYDFKQFKNIEKDKQKNVNRLVLLCGESEKKDCEAAIKNAQTICSAVTMVRHLVDLPSNIATPAYVVEQSEKLKSSFDVKVLGKNELEKLGCLALLAVSQGSVLEPKLVILEYGDKKQKPIAFVGKGVTFDSGGVNLKPTGYCETMKCDMAGAATVLGIFKAVSDLKLPVHIVGAMPLCENMISGSSYRPGDIIKGFNGKTMEIANTDAEGRVILSDALSYVDKNYSPKAIIDLATLTGACVSALGSHAAGLMGSDAQLLKDIEEAGTAVHERVWQLPMWEEYLDMVKSDIADVRNTGKPDRHAGAITGAAFLKNFVTVPWAHLDVAGTAYLDEPFWYMPKGGTGWGVRLFVEYLRTLK